MQVVTKQKTGWQEQTICSNNGKIVPGEHNKMHGQWLVYSNNMWDDTVEMQKVKKIK